MSTPTLPKVEKAPAWKSIKVNSSPADNILASKPGPFLPTPSPGLNSPSSPTLRTPVGPVGSGSPHQTSAPRFFPPASVGSGSASVSSAGISAHNGPPVSPQAPRPRGGPPPPKHAAAAQVVDFSQPKLTIVRDPKQLPTPTLVSEVTPVRDFSLPPHKFPPNRKVDSRAEAKLPADVKAMMMQQPPGRGVPPFVGSTFGHLPQSRVPIMTAPPPRATLPRMYPALTGQEYNNSGMLLSNRTANGKMLGSVAPRVVAETHVPYLPPEVAVGPDNPYVALNDTWTKCWDQEAGAVYYYNNVTGEATWIAPEGV